MEKPILMGHGPRLADIRINASEPYEMKHWAKQLKVSEAQLLAAVERVGPLIADIRASLKGQHDAAPLV